jgi:hypothetical protein
LGHPNARGDIAALRNAVQTAVSDADRFYPFGANLDRCQITATSEMSIDPHGYERPNRSLGFILGECQLAGDDVSTTSVASAMQFRSGSPSEFLGESQLALDLVANRASLPDSIRAFAGALADEIRQGFERVGGG